MRAGRILAGSERMRSRMNDIFSVEKLRQNWDMGEDADERKAVPESVPETSEPVMEFERLQELVNRRFPGERGEVLNILLEELRELLEKRFPESGDITGQDKDALNPVIEVILDQIEDLSEAFSLEGE